MAKVKKLRGVQQNQVYTDSQTEAVLTYLCEQSNSLYNCEVYLLDANQLKTSCLIDFFKNSKNGRMRKPRSVVQIMDQNFFNRILHLIHARPKQGRRMIGPGAAALWEVWQRINQLDQAVHLKRANAPERKRQSGGGRRVDSLKKTNS